jgi:hypothetical protein
MANFRKRDAAPVSTEASFLADVIRTAVSIYI